MLAVAEADRAEVGKRAPLEEDLPDELAVEKGGRMSEVLREPEEF